LLPSVLAENGGRYKVSSSWVSAFCAEALGWSFRKGTTAAQKLPNNFNEQGYMTILRLAYYVRVFDVPPSNPDLVSQSWSKATAYVPYKPGQQINLLDAWKDDVQQTALEKFAAGSLFPNKEESQADELEDMNGETAINNGDEVPMETLVHVLVQDGSHPAVGDDDIDDDMHGDFE
jgi:hypothetical protein